MGRDKVDWWHKLTTQEKEAANSIRDAFPAGASDHVLAVAIHTGTKLVLTPSGYSWKCLWKHKGLPCPTTIPAAHPDVDTAAVIKHWKKKHKQVCSVCRHVLLRSATEQQ